MRPIYWSIVIVVILSVIDFGLVLGCGSPNAHWKYISNYYNFGGTHYQSPLLASATDALPQSRMGTQVSYNVCLYVMNSHVNGPCATHRWMYSMDTKKQKV